MNGPQATRNADGKLCVLKEEMVQSVVKGGFQLEFVNISQVINHMTR